MSEPRCVCENPGARRTQICPVCSPKADTILSPRGEQTEAVACRDCKGRGYVAGDPEGAPIEGCDRCDGRGVTAGAGAPSVGGADVEPNLRDQIEAFLLDEGAFAEPHAELRPEHRLLKQALAALSPQALGEGHGSSAAPIPTEPVADRWADLERLAKAAAKRAPGLWGSDIEESEGSYGSGDDDRTGYMVPYMETEHGKRLFDAHYCDVAEIHEDYDHDDEGGATIYAWDEAAREIFEFIAAVQPSAVLELIAAARAKEAGE